MSVIDFNSKIATYSLAKDGKKVIEQKEVIIPENVSLPDDAPARMKILKAEGKKWYLTVVYHQDTSQPFALFCHTNSKEKTSQTSDAVDRLVQLAYSKGIKDSLIEDAKEKCGHEPNTTKLTRIISFLLRHGVLIKNIVQELDKMEDIYVGSLLFQLKKFLSYYILDGEEAEGVSCSECGGTLVYSEGCFKCRDCGHSKCG